METTPRIKTYKVKSNQKMIGKGVQGKFFALPDLPGFGVKLYGKGFKSRAPAKRGKDCGLASLEISQGLLGEGIPMVSQVYQECVVLYKGRYYPSILMEYFRGTHPDYEKELNDYKINQAGFLDPQGEPMGDYIRETLNEEGIDCDDLHHDNIILTPEGAVKVIDLSPTEVIQNMEEEEEYDELEF